MTENSDSTGFKISIVLYHITRSLEGGRSVILNAILPQCQLRSFMVAGWHPRWLASHADKQYPIETTLFLLLSKNVPISPLSDLPHIGALCYWPEQLPMHTCNLNTDKKGSNRIRWGSPKLLLGTWTGVPASPEAHGCAENGLFTNKTKQKPGVLLGRRKGDCSWVGNQQCPQH